MSFAAFSVTKESKSYRQRENMEGGMKIDRTQGRKEGKSGTNGSD
jgi:hypothetical protein